MYVNEFEMARICLDLWINDYVSGAFALPLPCFMRGGEHYLWSRVCEAALGLSLLCSFSLCFFIFLLNVKHLGGRGSNELCL